MALAVTMLGATSAPAMAVTAFDKGSLMFNSATPQPLNLTSDDGASVNGPVTLLTASGTAGAVPFTATGSCEGATKTPPVTKPLPCTLSVTYTGAAGATAGAQLTVSTTSGSKAVLLRANAPKATVCPTQGSTDCKASTTVPTAFSTTVGTPTQQVFDIKAGPDGTAPLTVTGVTAAAPYTVDASACAGIAPGGRCSAIVTFNPTAAGTFPATLTINSNDPISPGPSVSLTGAASAAGTTPPPNPGTIPGTIPKPGTTSPGTTPGTATRRAGITGFRFSARSIAPGGKGTFRFTLSAPARVTISIDRRLPGKRVKYLRAGSIIVASAKTGANTTKFSGRIKGRVLKVGTYRVTISATNKAGTAAKRYTTFTVKRKKR